MLPQRTQAPMALQHSPGWFRSHLEHAGRPPEVFPPSTWSHFLFLSLVLPNGPDCGLALSLASSAKLDSNKATRSTISPTVLIVRIEQWFFSSGLRRRMNLRTWTDSSSSSLQTNHLSRLNSSSYSRTVLQPWTKSRNLASRRFQASAGKYLQLNLDSPRWPFPWTGWVIFAHVGCLF